MMLALLVAAVVAVALGGDAGFSSLGDAGGVSGTAIFPADPSCYPLITKYHPEFIQTVVPQSIPWNAYSVSSYYIDFQDVRASSGQDYFLKQIVQNSLGAGATTTLKYFFTTLIYQANNALLYKQSPALQGKTCAQNIIPATGYQYWWAKCTSPAQYTCIAKNNQDADIKFLYDDNNHVLRVRFKVAVQYHYAYAITKTLTSVDKIQDALQQVMTSSWLTDTIPYTAGKIGTGSNFICAMKKLGQPGASSCGAAAEAATEAAQADIADIADRTLAGPLNIKAVGAVKIVGSGATGKAMKTAGGR
jgi:hypothetical protein